MVVIHRESGDKYRLLLRSFSVERQKASVVYMSLATGEIFDRDAWVFDRNFQELNDPQLDIVPKAPKPVTE